MIVKKDSYFEEYLRHPREQKYYQFMNITAVLFHLSHPSWWGLPRVPKLVEIHGRILATVPPCCFSLQFIYMCTYYSELSFTTLGTLFTLIPATIITFVKVAVGMTSSYKTIMMKLMDSIHIYNILDVNDDFIRKKLLKVERNIRWVTAFLVVFMFMDWLLWTFSPILKNIKNKELIAKREVRLETSLYMWMPFDYSYDYRNWVIMHTLNVYTVFMGGMIMAFLDSVNFIFLFHFLGHIDILRHKITTFFTIQLNDKDTKERIVEIIKYHCFVLSAFHDTQAGFGANVALNYLQNLFNDSLLLYLIMIGDEDNRGSYIFMMLFHMGGLIVMSFTLEQIRIKTDDLALDLYQVPWEKMSVSNQKLLIPIMLKMQKTLVFEGSCGLQTGVRPLFNIIKSTFSYYVMLESTIT